jgi:hypothetical protein
MVLRKIAACLCICASPMAFGCLVTEGEVANDTKDGSVAEAAAGAGCKVCVAVCTSGSYSLLDVREHCTAAAKAHCGSSFIDAWWAPVGH